MFKGIIVTHRHGDHILGLPTILQMAKHKGFEKITIVSIHDALNGIKGLLEASGSQDLLNIVDLRPLEISRRIDVGGFGIEFIEAIHPIPAASVKIYVDGICIVYSGDTAYNPALAEFAKGCRLLIHEASGYYSEAYRYGHSSYTDAIKIALKASIDILTLIHFYIQPQPIDTVIGEGNRLKILLPQPCTSLEL